MKFVLWFEPERVTAISRIAKEHPEWVMRVGQGDGESLEDIDPQPVSVLDWAP
jgi:alpha-galactosidase